MPSVHKAVAKSATKYSHRAVTSFLAEDYEDFYLAGGVAIEHAMKARLARENIAFIAPDRHFKSALALWRARDDIDGLAKGTRTVSGQEALDRVCALDPSFAGRHREPVADIIRYRNGEAHLGSAGAQEHRETLAAFVRALHDLLLVDPAKFWGRHAGFVETVVDESLGLVAQRVAEQVASAEDRFRRTVGAMEPDLGRVLSEQFLRDRDQRISDDAIGEDCPACGSPALLFGEMVIDVDVEFDRDGSVTGGGHYVVFVAETFECWACQLELSGQDQLESAGFEVRMDPPEDFDNDDFLRDYYAE